MSTKLGGTLRWQAPELLLLNTDTNPHITFATDVYAFAMVCYEMFSGTLPFDDLANDPMVIFALQQGRRPSPPSHHLSLVRGWSDDILHLIEACWAEMPSERLSVSNIVEKLCALPIQPVDERPLDTFKTSITSHLSHSHPFALVMSTKST